MKKHYNIRKADRRKKNVMGKTLFREFPGDLCIPEIEEFLADVAQNDTKNKSPCAEFCGIIFHFSVLAAAGKTRWDKGIYEVNHLESGALGNTKTSSRQQSPRGSGQQRSPAF
jgi:hypothetical protein